MSGHEVEIKHPTAFDGHTAVCSCGWRSEEMASLSLALLKARAHVPMRQSIVFVNRDGTTTPSYLELS